MNQQINLHQPIFRKQRALFSARIGLRVCAVWILALAAIFGLALTRDRVQAREEASLTRARDATLARMQEMSALQAGAGGQGQSLEADLARLQAERTQKEGVLRVLASGELGNTKGFLTQIDALADRRLAGLWLTHVGLSGGGSEISLRGVASAEALLPEYLEHLSDESGLPGTRFGDVRMARSEDDRSVSFELSTRAGGESP